MRINDPRTLGLYVRDRRQRTARTQADLARAANVSRRWLSDLEAGKPTAEIGLVLQTLNALGVVLDAGPERTVPGQVDLDDHLRKISRWRPDTDALEGSGDSTGS